MIAVPASGGLTLLLGQKQEAYKTLTKEQERFWKRILIVDDNKDITTTFKAAIEDSNDGNDTNKKILLQHYHNSNQISMIFSWLTSICHVLNGFELREKIFAIDINVRVCLMSSGEINWEALREIYPTRQEGCFIRKPVTIDYLLKRIRSELD